MLQDLCLVRDVVPTPVGVNRLRQDTDRSLMIVVPTPVGVNRRIICLIDNPPKLSPRPWG